MSKERQMTKEEYKAKTSKYTEKDFKNPTEEMTNDIWWQLACADWELATGKMKKYNSVKEMLDEIYGDEDSW